MKRFSPLLLRAGLRYMLRHRWQGLLALTGIVLGVAVVLAVDLANSGARAAFELSAQQLQGKATHRLTVPGATLPDEVYVTLQRQSGAPPMAPVVNGCFHFDHVGEQDWVAYEDNEDGSDEEDAVGTTATDDLLSQRRQRSN